MAPDSSRRADALVLFGATGDLAFKKIFPALQSMAQLGQLDMPVVVLTREGHLITNAHVVGDAGDGTAEFADGTVARFDVVGRDPLSDLAVVRADREVPSPPEYGEADSLLVGSLVVVVGVNAFETRLFRPRSCIARATVLRQADSRSSRRFSSRAILKLP